MFHEPIAPDSSRDRPGIPDLDRLTDQQLCQHIRKHLDCRHVATMAEAIALRDQGFEPVECSFGKVSVVGPLRLDHHGALSREEPVSIKAARLAMAPGFSPMRKFVLTGLPDGDAIYAVLALSGQIRPDLKIASAIAELDLDPIGRKRLSGPYLREVAFEMNGVPSHCEAGVTGALVSGARAFDARALPETLVSKALDFEMDRKRRAVSDIVERGMDCILVNSNAPARDVWHAHGSILVQYKPAQQVITISGCTQRAADYLYRRSVYSIFGQEGFDRFYPQMDEILSATGSGGRPDIGGSPRGGHFSLEQASAIFNAFKQIVEKSLN